MNNFKREQAIRIHPSIASSNLLTLKDEIDFIDKKYGFIHIDIEDGNYIRNITFGNKLLNIICKNSSSYKSVHLMVNYPLDFLDTIIKNRIEVVFLHIDNLRYPSEVIQEFLNQGIQVGIALNPYAELSSNFYIKEVKNILLMMCEPDTKNQIYLDELEAKVKLYVERGFNVWCDGGISVSKCEHLKTLGASDVVLGRAVFNDDEHSSH